MTLPGFYLAVTNFHTQILPTTLLLSFAEARQGVPFPAVVEVLIMELSFELLREAGVRLPGAMGNTIGIVGGLIIGQAAVEANYEDERDFIWRQPFRKLRKRPIYANPKERTKLTFSKKR